jgi:ankyrin repeat protein
VVKLLLATGGVDPDSKDEDGRTPLSRATADGHEGVMKLLQSRNDLYNQNFCLMFPAHHPLLAYPLYNWDGK